MADVAFEYKKLFKGATREAVFDATLEWLTKKGAKVESAEKPTVIECTYGRADAEYNWDKELLRTIDFEFVASKEYVGVGVWQAPTRKTVKRVLESPAQANITWRDWLNECWDYVQGKVGPAPAPAGTPMRIPSAKSAAPTGTAPPPKTAPPPPPKAPQKPQETSRPPPT